MIAESSEFQKFRRMIGEAPELTNPCRMGKQLWPYTVCRVDQESGRGILETEPDAFGRFIRTEYNRNYGVTAKRKLSLWQNGEEQPLMDYGKIVYNEGAVDIIFEAGYRPWFSAEPTPAEIKNLQDLHDFSVHISIFPANASEGQPFLAKIAYGLNSAVPIITDFLLADYQDGLRGNVSRVDQGEGSSPRYTYPETCFGWETLKGAKVGLKKIEEGHNVPHFVSWDTRINSPQAKPLEGTPYREKITHFREKYAGWGKGRLRFSRINTNTGESWMFSVPEWMNNDDFIRDLQNQDLGEFARLHKVAFCVKKRGEERQWFATSFRDDKPYRF